MGHACGPVGVGGGGRRGSPSVRLPPRCITTAVLGEIYMIAVDPGAQGLGVTALTGVAASWLGQSGMLVAMIGTGGDPGHAPARWACEKAGCTAGPLCGSSRPCSGSRRRLVVTGLRFWRGRALAMLLLWHRRQPRRQAGPGTCRAAGVGSHRASLPGSGRQRAPGGYSTGPISAPASSA